MSRYVRGAMPDEDTEALSCTISPRAGGQSINKAASILFAVHDARDGSTRNGKEGLRDLVMSGRQGVDTRGAVSSGNIFSLHICILQQLNTGVGNGLGTRRMTVCWRQRLYQQLNTGVGNGLGTRRMTVCWRQRLYGSQETVQRPGKPFIPLIATSCFVVALPLTA